MMRHNKTGLRGIVHMSDTDIRSKIRSKEILLAGNRQLKIYGLLSCKSGKRMKRKNRIFFANEEEAIALGFRPCAHCMPGDYLKWRNQ